MTLERVIQNYYSIILKEDFFVQIVKRDQNDQGGIEIDILGVLQLFWKNIILIIAVTALMVAL